MPARQHSREEDPSREAAKRKLLIGTLLCFLFMLAEIVITLRTPCTSML